ncbi:uncharacterized protein BP5553_05692 [Venustampulla echinocandica]|uniref:Cytochrome P450 n=1 Tax=Venustampulla echinocandica TaxID=2656787 RepID=A0A370TLD6_9HELO|nr:uncharacterized protein BP5553_05692 [Venustampulla echinocandica]RDL36340.1 hypothetical protein BP5553_05692 [Venustampulla echinocandica]
MSMVLLPTTALALLAWLMIRQLAKLTKKPKLDMPYLDFEDGDNSMQRYLHDAGSILERGYEQYLKEGLPFAMFNYMDASTPMAVIPLKYLEEVRSASTCKLSFNSFLNKSTVAKDIGGPLVTDRVIRVVRQDLNRALNEMIEPIQQACDKVFGILLPPSRDWTPLNGHSLLWPLVSRIMARTFVGPELWDSEEWHAVVSSYFHAGLAASQRVRDGYHPWLRWTAKYFDKDIKAIYAVRRKGEELLKPVIDARIADARNQANGQGPGFNDGVRWLVDAYRAENKPIKAEQIMQDEAFLVGASVHGITVNALSILFDLMDRPESLAEIQAEISQVHAEYGGWTRKSLGALRVMDSFMKESQRLHTPQHCTMQRRALEGYTFKDGLYIPAGTSIFLPSRLLGRDPDVHPDGAKFDAKRWKRMREEGDATKFHFASLQNDMLPWGSGPHACPGRFLVQEVIKIIFIHLVTKYDVKYSEGVESRPPDYLEHTNSIPNIMALLLFKER